MGTRPADCKHHPIHLHPFLEAEKEYNRKSY